MKYEIVQGSSMVMEVEDIPNSNISLAAMTNSYRYSDSGAMVITAISACPL